MDPQTSNMQMFQHAQNLLFNGGTFSQSHQHYYSVGKDIGLNNLKQYIATDAIFDAAERFPPPKCHPGTREKIIAAIMDWINDPETAEQAMWLYGPAGGGKSAIAQSIAILLQEMFQESKYAASFFFTKGAPGRGDGNKLFPTIAYQLAINFPSFRPFLDAAMINNPTLPTKSTDVQLRELIIEPLKHVEEWPAHHPTVIIDGLDECSGSKDTQLVLLSSLCKAITDHHIPLRFLIVSRPEYWIADHFQVGEFSHAARQISLHDDTEAYAGIENYLRDEFSRIYEENLPVMSCVPRPWPPDHLIQRFAINASGQFVYASTVIKFVGHSSNFCDPQEQLRILATPGPHDASAFSDLDRLYATILSAYPRLESMKYVLGGILCDLHENVIQEFFGMPLGEIHLVLRAISSLIRIRNHKHANMYRMLEDTYGPPSFSLGNGISFCHLSFREFLENHGRSGCYSVNKYAIRSKFCHAILNQGLKMLRSCLGDEVSNIDHTISRMGLSVYRATVQKLGCLLHDYYHLPFVMKALQDMDGILCKILSRQPVYLAHASHILWFARDLTYWLGALPLHQKPFNYRKELFKSLAYNLDAIVGISIKQLLQEIPVHMPVFSYLAVHVIWGSRPRMDDIKASMGITYDDIILELQHLHDLVCVYFDEADAYILASWRVFSYWVDNHIHDGQQIAAWDNIRLQILASKKERIMGIHWHLHDREKDWYPQGDHLDVQMYMNEKHLSDINSVDYFEDGLRRTILDMIIHPQFPAISNQDGLGDFVLASLSWLDRQMTGPRKILISEYDSTLLETMQSAAKNIFLNAYLVRFKNEYCSNLVMTHWQDPGLSVNIRISNQSPNGIPSIIEESYCDGHRFYTELFYQPGSDNVFQEVHRFHDAMMTSKSSGIISPADWYPHLAAYLLIMLVRLQYGTLNPGFEVHWASAPRKGFSKLLECMPYATPSVQNLDSMRALHHLCPKIDRKRRWRPPFGFCSLAIDFLNKYDESSLSPLEFARFRTWLDELKTHESKRIVMDAEYEISSTFEDDYTTDEDEDEDEDDSGLKLRW